MYKSRIANYSDCRHSAPKSVSPHGTRIVLGQRALRGNDVMVTYIVANDDTRGQYPLTALLVTSAYGKRALESVG